MPPKLKCDYAGRPSNCRHCILKLRPAGIDKRTLRIGKSVKGLHGHWNWEYYHATCFFFSYLKEFLEEFSKNKEIDNLYSLESDHKRAIQQIIASECYTEEVIQMLEKPVTDIIDFKIQCNNKTDVKCTKCEEIIEKKQMCVSKKSEKLLFHLKCFRIDKENVGYYKDVEYIPGFDKLDEHERYQIMGVFKRSHDDKNIGAQKKMRAGADETVCQGENNAMLLINSQDVQIDKLKNILEGYKTNDLRVILQANNQDHEPPISRSECVNRLADAFAFGALERCPECYDEELDRGAQLVLYQFGYKCTGDYNPDAKCQYVTRTPDRNPIIIPEGEVFKELSMMDFQIGERLFPDPGCSSRQVVDDGEVVRAVPATARGLFEMQPSSPQAGPSHLRSCVEEMDSGYSSPMTKEIGKHLVKGRAVVHPLSGLESTAHVYVDSNENVYSTVLLKIDVLHELNLCYHLQLLESDDGNDFYVFRAYGAVGQEQMSTMKNYDKLEDAIGSFEEIFYEKTQQYWDGRAPTFKKAGYYRMSELDYGDHLKEESKELPATISELASPVHRLVKAICNIDAMNQILCEYEIDTRLLPVGRLAASRVDDACQVLALLLSFFKNRSETKTDIIANTNRFFELIPHNFGQRGPPLLDNTYIINEKMAMLEQLRNLQCSYRVLQSGCSEQLVKTVEEKYQRLNTNVEVLAEDTREYNLIVRYVANSHSPMHYGYSLEVQQVFRAQRFGEAAQFARHSGLRRRLLWHGSSTTSFAGILAEGMLISPFEKPRNGALFGRGLYFAEMVSKSANYCDRSPYGILMLCDVALGNMRRCTIGKEWSDKEWLDEEDGTNSVWGVGKWGLDPSECEDLDGAQVALGRPQRTTYETKLAHHEYIVYDVHQVKIKYLVCVKFNNNEN